MPHILVVDDDPQVLTSINDLLETEGYTSSLASSGQEALDLLEVQRPDVAILDIIMPELDGVELCRRIRANPFLARMPILFLTAKGRPRDIALGLEAGGDDYLVKPFQVTEFMARIQALLRRSPGGTLDVESDTLSVGTLHLHTTRPEFRIVDQRIDLTTVEHRLLHYLMIYSGQPIPTDRLLTDVWEYPPGVGNPKVVNVCVARIRRKIEPEPDSPRYLLNVRGQGYLLNG